MSTERQDVVVSSEDDAAQPSDAMVDEASVAAVKASRPPLLTSLVILAVIVLIGQVVVLVGVFNTSSQVSDLSDDVEALTVAATDAVSADVGELTELGSGQSSSAPDDTREGGSGTTFGGNLPRFLGAGADPALGRDLGTLAALEYYSGGATTIDSADGIARAYMVWAHWCPFCQEEMPVISEWHEANAASFENFELVSVTTAIDETAENPLVPYLDEGQFPFPVLVDDDGSLSRRLGVNAFPFWVFTAPDGTVIGRAAGFIELDDLEVVFEQLEGL